MSRRLLQIAVSLAALNAILGGILYLTMGLDGLSMTGSTLTLDSSDPSWITIDYLFRAVCGIWLGLGLMYAYMVPSIEKHTTWFRFACLSMFLMGVGRLLSVQSLGAGDNPVFAIVLEFTFPILLVFWQYKVAQKADGRRIEPTSSFVRPRSGPDDQ